MFLLTCTSPPDQNDASKAFAGHALTMSLCTLSEQVLCTVDSLTKPTYQALKALLVWSHACNWVELVHLALHDLVPQQGPRRVQR